MVKRFIYQEVMKQLLSALKNKCDNGSVKEIKQLSNLILHLADKFFDFNIQIVSEQENKEKKDPPN